MGDVPAEDVPAADATSGGEEAPSSDPSLFGKAGISAGGQIYTETQLGQYFYGGRGDLWYGNPKTDIIGSGTII